MSILVFPRGNDPLDRAVAARLLAQGDEVRVLVGAHQAEEWRELGVHVAVGDPTDPDLVERAAQNCRSVVLLGRSATDTEVIAAVAEGAVAAGVDRLIACRAGERSAVPPLGERWSRGYVIVEQTSGRWPRARTASEELVAEAIDAADDLAGDPRLEVDLNEPRDLARLGL